MPHRPYHPRSWLALLATLAFLPPAPLLAEDRVITLLGDGGDAWTFEKNLEGELPDGGCDKVLIASPGATVEGWQAAGRFGAVVPLQEGDNEVRAICHLGEADRSVSEPQHWRVRLRDVPKAWIRIVPAEDGIIMDAGASEQAPARSAPIVAHQWRSVPGNPQPLTNRAPPSSPGSARPGSTAPSSTVWRHSSSARAALMMSPRGSTPSRI